MAPKTASRKSHPVKVEAPVEYTDDDSSGYSVEEAPVVRKAAVTKAVKAPKAVKEPKKRAPLRELTAEEQEQYDALELNISETQKSLRKLQSDKRKIAKPKKATGESGLKKHLLLHPKLCDFLKQPHGSRFARPQITKLFAARLKQGDPEKPLFQGFIILADADPELLDLLGPAIHPLQKSSEELGWSYQNLSKYLHKYFIKDPVTVAE